MRIIFPLLLVISAVTISVARLPFTPQPGAEPKVLQPSFKRDTFRITNYGAKSDGIFLNTTSINNAITACNKKGGGVVLIPAGFWLTGPVVLQSNVNLHLQKNALLQFTNDFFQYPIIEGNWEGVPQMRNQSPISAKGAQNIAITGAGIIDGWGDAWRMVKKDKLTESQWQKLVTSGGIVSADKKTWYPSEKMLKGSSMTNAGYPGKSPQDYEAIKDFLRPNLVVLANCNTVLLEGVTFQNSPAWCLHPLVTNNLTVRNVTVKNPWYAQNGDGIDVDACSNVLIENSSFDVGDDGICIKSGRDEAGRKRGLPTQNLIVRNCVVYHAHGGFVIGSEMSGGAKNIFVYNCSFIGTDIGLRFKTTRGRGGVVENIYINNIVMKDIAGEAILFDMYYAAKDPVPLAGEERMPPKVETLPVTEATPQFRNFYINNVTCNGAEKAIFIRGIPEMNVKNVLMENMVIKAKKGIDFTEATGINLKNVNLITSDTDPVASIHNSADISLNQITYPSDSKLLFNVTGEKSRNIIVTKTDATKAKSAVEFNYGANKNALQINK